ncbi:LysR family transcriptional regulator [Shinella sp. CPCC 100929]|uniref:LysR family transcriptional regulator n=1 Tax=Shinella lacus TaxID=2654216 RepID=A0ABT1R1F5_9HYPH|nr:LysR substrate-binding domain-containing protein [Shinella lacus]MCQ4629005.1 LysR family transcriptional regulator [Shinella lacus]
MKLQHLQYLCEIVDSGLNISNASDALNRSQPGVSRYMKQFEDELGVKVFHRSGKRLLGLTKAGQEILGIARRMISDAGTIKTISDEYSARDEGTLVIATTHTQARYMLPPTVLAFVQRYPKVRLSLKQGNPTEVATWLTSGMADLSIAASPSQPAAPLLLLPSYDLGRIILTVPDHELLSGGPITLERLSRFPMITYDDVFTGSIQIHETFRKAGLEPRVIVSATDSDVMKAYVKIGLGIAIVGDIVYDEKVDADIRAINVSHLFRPNTIYIGLNRESYVRSYTYDFIRMFDPRWTAAKVRKTLERAHSSDAIASNEITAMPAPLMQSTRLES